MTIADLDRMLDEYAEAGRRAAAISRRVQAALSGLDISLPTDAVRILAAIRERPLMVTEIAALSDHTTNVSYAINRLEQTGLVTRNRGATDRRRILLKITENGSCLLGRITDTL